MAFSSKLGGLAAGAVLIASAAFAQTYPDRQITMVVPFSAGGPTDTVGRLIAEKIEAGGAIWPHGQAPGAAPRTTHAHAP